MTNILETKEQYNKFVTFWKDFHREGKHKCKEIPIESDHFCPTSKTYLVSGMIRKSDLTISHHAIYLAVLGKDLNKAMGTIKEDTLNHLSYSIKSEGLFNFYVAVLSREQYDLSISRIKEWINIKYN